MREENQLYWIWLSERFGTGSKYFPSFADKFDDPYDVYRMSEEEIERIDGLSDRLKERLCDKELDSAYSILKFCKKNKTEVIGYGDTRYPKRLKTIENPPVLLYCMGELPDIDRVLCVGMVGTRKMSEYGKQTAYKISYELAAANACIVSGMAVGIDAVCACGAIEGGGKTVAVLGGGLAVVYPREHERLMRSIVKHGAVISEYPPFERPKPHNFPQRNRIISGLCQGVVVVEGAHGSGALITAARAISQGRELFAIPGKVSDYGSEGPNELIRNGANVILSADDIINHYDFLYHDAINYRSFSSAKKKSHFTERALKAYGVSATYHKGRFAKQDVADEPSAFETAENESNTEQKIQIDAKDELAFETDGKSDGEKETLLASMDKGSRDVYAMLPDGVSFTPDSIAGNGLSVSQIMTALTILEISGLVTSLPGGTYKKK